MRFFLFSIILLTVQLLSAQEAVEEKRFPFTNQFLDIDLETDAQLSIKAWDKQEIYIKVTYQINKGVDNEALMIDVDNYQDRLAFDLNLDVRRLTDSEDCCCEDNRRSYYDGNKAACMDVKITVMIPAKAAIGVESITSDVTVKGMISDIEIETVTGAIDLTWAEDEGADLRMQTTTGDLYTNVDLARKSKKGLPNLGSRNIKAQYLKGGKEITLKTITGVIYFRKSTD